MDRPKFFRPFVLATLLSPLAASSCDSVPYAQETQELAQTPAIAALTVAGVELNPERRGIGLEPIPPSAGGGDLPSAGRFDARRSLAVTDVPIVSKFSFKEVMDKIAGGKDLGLGLFQRWWATQGSACQPTLNGFDYPCRASGEGQEATNNEPFSEGDNGYMALGLFNRFDLAPTDGANCGEYRIVFGRRSGVSNPTNRNLISFEAVLPNPTPASGLEGCRPVANFWDGLSDIGNIEERANALKSFYFRGLAGFAPVIAAEHFAQGAGQVRTNQFMQFNWSLREFKFQPGPQPTFKPVTVKTNPHFALFDASLQAPLTGFQGDFISQIPSLRSGDINTFTYIPPAGANRGESNEQSRAHDYATRPIHARGAFARGIDGARGSLTRRQVLNRATALSCAGCHQHSNDKDIGQNLRWPSSMQFTHISEATETVQGVQRHLISPALTTTFLPHRQAVLEAFLARLDSCPQTTLLQQVSLQPDSEWGKDAMIVSRFNSNGGDHPSMFAVAWGTGSQSAIVRSLIDFDVSAIATKSRVLRADLRLFGTGSNVGSSNRGMLSRITQPWDEFAVTWFTQPASDRSQPVMIAATSNASQDYNLDVTEFIQTKLAAPGQNHGMLLQLEAENHHNELHFHSSDSTDPLRRPALELQVTTPICAQITPCVPRGPTLVVTPANNGPIPAGASFTFDVAVTNNNSATCAEEDFFVSSTSVFPDLGFDPRLWQLIIPSGETQHVPVKVMTQVQAEPGERQLVFESFQSRTDKVSTAPATVTATIVIAEPLGCVVRTRRELLIKHLSVVADPARTTFNQLGNAGAGQWTFKHLMEEMAPTPAAAPDMVEEMFNTWLSPQTVNGFVVPARPLMGPIVLEKWPRTADGKLNLAASPLQLEAIVNRFDLRNLDQGNAGEGRFVFSVLRRSENAPLNFTIILEYKLPATSLADVKKWADDWHALGALPVPSEAYNTALAALTERFVKRGAGPGRPNGSAISAVRTNEIVLTPPEASPAWELREFNLNAATGLLTVAPIDQTPDVSLNNSPMLADWINANQAAIIAGTHTVPLSFNGTPFQGGAIVNRSNDWRAPGVDPETRHRFALNTCNGCHGGETNTDFLHISPRFNDREASLSGFMTGDLGRRNIDLARIVCPAIASSPARSAGARAATFGAPAPTEEQLRRGIQRVH